VDAFSYLSVLLSIIIGLAITQVLQGYRALLLARQNVRLYFPTIAWSVYLLLMATQSWWASFGLSDRRDWSFVSFTIILLQTVFLYMIAGLVFPDMPADRPTDLRAHYHREARPFFLLIILMLATSLLKDWILDYELPGPENLMFHLAFGSTSLLAMLSAREWLHRALAIVTGVLLVAYVGLLFARLSLA
jgi:hypothetical protein